MKIQNIWRVLSLVVALFAALSLTFAPVFAPDFTLAPAFADDKDEGDDEKDKDDNGDHRDHRRRDDHRDRRACRKLPSHAELKDALRFARAQDNGGFNLDMWATVVNRDGVVCAVARTGDKRGDQWPGSRAISAQKANTANAFSLPGLALSTANLYSAAQPGGGLFGLQFSNPVDFTVAYRGDPRDYGKRNDPMVGGKIGGVNVFGGGLALYNEYGKLVGAVGVSGDSSCADHNIAWRTRNELELDHVPGGISGDAERPDNIIFDIDDPTGHQTSAGGFGHAHCIVGNEGNESSIAASLPAIP